MLWARQPTDDQTVAAAFGPFESWLLRLGEHQLLLHPAYRRWYYLDRLHGTWESTGFGPGEATFVVVGRRLGYRPKAAGPTRCATCGSTVPGDSRFCPACGAHVAIVRGRCRACGAQDTRGGRFCTRCGAPLHGAEED